MADYSLRSEVLKTDLVKDITYIKSLQFYNPHFAEYLQESLDELKSQNSVYYDEACKIIESNRSRHKRLKNRLKNMLKKGQCIFLTLTFTDEVLHNTSAATRKKYVVRTLKRITDDYVANIDFGKNTDREHYHAVIRSDFYDQKDWPYGFSKGKPIIYKTEDPQAVTNYLIKLTNHALKETCRRAQVIYSKRTCP